MLTPESVPRKNPSVATDHFQHRETIWRVLVDVISLTILLIAVGAAQFIIKPFTRGFSCSDTLIRYPYKHDTIPTSALMISSIVLPLLCRLQKLPNHSIFDGIENDHLELCGTKVPHISLFVRNVYILTVIFVFGYLATLLLTLMTKSFLGNLRPHFLDVCQPSYNCSAVTLLYQFNAYLQEGSHYTCQNGDTSALREARRSFFSGHASLIFYGCTWLIMYIHVASPWRHLGIVGHLLQVAIAILAFYIVVFITGYTPITDYQHHWYDVLVEAIAGSFIAFVAFKFIPNWRHYHARSFPHTMTNRLAVSSMYQERDSADHPVSPYNNERTITSRV